MLAKQKQKLKEYNEEVAEWHKHKALAQTQVVLQPTEGLLGMDFTQVQAKQRDEKRVITGGRMVLVISG